MKSHKFKLFLLLSLALSACNDSLELNPLDQISSSTFWKTKGDFDKALTANYASMQADPWAVELPVWNCLTDDGFAQHNSGSAKEITSGSISPSTGGYVSGVYSESYKAIARVNIFLAQLNAYTNTDVTEADRKLYEAEVRFLRGFYYFQLYYLYGDVPLVLEPLTLETQNQPKVPASEILAQIISDLDFAIANLNANAFPKNNGHAAVTSAQALKARVLMYAAYGEDGIPDPAILAQVKALTSAVIPLYNLSPEYEDIFRDAGQKNNPEIIYSTNFLAPNNTRPWDMYYGDWLVASPLQNFVDAFEYTDGLPYGVSPLTDKKEPFKNRDPRLSKTVFVDHPDFGGGRVHIPSNSRPSGYGVMKFLVPENIPFGFSTLSQQNAVVLRLADVLLMYAEAQNEIAGPDETVYKAVNDIRLRSKMPALLPGQTKAQMRERIRHERRIELGFEGLRYYDLKRWHIAEQVLNNVKDSFVPYKFEKKFYKWPIPQPEIDKSGGALKQNEEYL